MIARTLWLAAALLTAPAVHAEDAQCKLALGRGWPAATENYGTAVEKLLAGEAKPALRYTLLPKVGTERGLMLIPDLNGGDWTLRYAVADERVHYWGPTQLELRTEQTPDVDETTIPADVATRVIDTWQRALGMAAPEGSSAPFTDEDTWLFVAGDLRVSGLRPECELGEQLRLQIELLTDASDEGPEKRQKRWRKLGEMLDRMQTTLDEMAATAAQ